MASVDHGASTQFYLYQAGRTPAFQTGQPTVSKYVEPLFSSGPLHERDFGKSETVIPGINNGNGIPATSTYYKMQGWYVAGSVYETWIAINAPNNTPPSGHTLTHIVIVSINF